MHSIGKFSAISGIPIKTLRYYDQIGVLRPALIDEDTGYRYYHPQQIVQSKDIQMYRDFGFPLEEIGRLLSLEADGALEELERLIQSRDEWIQGRIRGVRKVEKKLRDLRSSSKAKRSPVSIVQVRPQRVASLEKFAGFEDVSAMLIELVEYLEAHRVTTNGPPMMLWGRPIDGHRGAPPIEVAVPVLGSLDGLRMLSGKTLSGGSMASVVCEGRRSEFGKHYQEIFDWIYECEYSITGPVRELHLDLKTTGRPGDELRVELQVPISIDPDSRRAGAYRTRVVGPRGLSPGPL